MNFTETFFILAQEAPADLPQKPGGLFSNPLVFMVIIMVMFYFVLIRPQKKQQKAAEEMRNKLGNGDKVITSGGIHGIISGQSKTTVSVKVADGTSIKLDRASIATVLSSKGEGVVAADLDDDVDDIEDTKD